MELLRNKPGETLFLLGNEAIVRGALEAGMTVATTYPGTPSSEIGDVLHEIAEDAGVHFEFSTNEKVAVEMAVAAAITGHRSMAFMKHVGLNVASDPFITAAYMGTGDGAMILVVADDPSCYSSQNEQDSRYYAGLANVPMLEPATPEEAKRAVKEGFEMSEDLRLPVIVRTTTRVSHTRGPVRLGEMKEKGPIKRKLRKDPWRYVHVPAVARSNHKRLLKKISGPAKKMSERSKFNKILKIGSGEGLNVIASGVSVNYIRSVMEDEGISGGILKIGMSHPLPEEKISEFLKGKDKVLVVEELEPIIETEIRELSQFHGLDVEIIGKRQEVFPRFFEFNTDVIRKGLAKVLGRKVKAEPREEELELPTRPPVLCPGCPHRATYYAAKTVKGIYSNDIGCYTLGISPPLETADTCICMGSSIGMGCGFSIATDHKIISFIGDSTFFHAGIPALINAVHEQHDLIVVIMDNGTTAMTGFQPHPGTSVSGMGGRAQKVKAEDVAKGCGVEFIKIVNSIEDIEKAKEAFEEASRHEGVSVIVSRAPCTLQEVRRKRKAGEKIEVYKIDQEECTQCNLCINRFACPAFCIEDELVKINPTLCNGCGVCAEICPFDAIMVR